MGSLVVEGAECPMTLLAGSKFQPESRLPVYSKYDEA